MNNYLESVIEKGEGQQLSFIQNTEDRNTIISILCSFANTDGGSLLIGVKKNGKVIGTEPSETLSFISDICENLCKPKVPVEFNIHQFTYKMIVEIIVKKSNEVHLYSDNGKWNCYIRVNESTVKINSVLIKYLELLKKGILILPDFSSEMNELYAIFCEKKLTFTQLTKLSKIKRDKLEHLLAKLIYLNKIKFEFDNETILFSRNQDV